MTGSANSDCVLGNTQLEQFDALIVGSGAGGSAAAHKLTEQGWNVLVLEAGNNYFPGLDQEGPIPWPLYSNDELKNRSRPAFWQDPLLEPRTFRQDKDEKDENALPRADVNLLPRMVGGGAVLSTVSYPRFTEIDFRMKSALDEAGRDVSGTSFTDWPLTYDELEPFYLEAERLSGVAGADEGEDASDPFASSRKGEPFPLPPQPEMYVGRVLANGARKLGYHPFNYPSAINTRTRPDYEPDRPVTCVSCGYCSYSGCPRNAKGSPAVTTLRRALRTGRCQLRYNAQVSRVRVEGPRATGVDYFDANGDLRTATADRVILAASPIETIRLCFLSGGLGNASGHLGRHLMFHFQTTAAGFFRQRLHGERGRSVTNGMSDFRGIKTREEGGGLRDDAPLAGVIEFSTSSEPINSTLSSLQALPIARVYGLSLKDILVESPFQQHIAVMIMQGEDAPQYRNRVDLDPDVKDIFDLPVPRVTYTNHDFEKNASQHYKPLMLDVLAAAGAEFGLIEPFNPANPPVSRHIVGGLRMGNDPRDSVCDAYGKLHGFDNLYCVDGSVFVTGSGYNPTPTIIALALRAAGNMVSG